MLRYLLEQDAHLYKRIESRARVALLRGLIPPAEGLAQKASRGNIQAVKLLFEATKFYNPRLDTEHSGEIEIKLNIPRPKDELAPDSTAAPSTDRNARTDGEFTS